MSIALNLLLQIYIIVSDKSDRVGVQSALIVRAARRTGLPALKVVLTLLRAAQETG